MVIEGAPVSVGEVAIVVRDRSECSSVGMLAKVKSGGGEVTSRFVSRL